MSVGRSTIAGLHGCRQGERLEQATQDLSSSLAL
jgi:hypothetical protein